MRSNIPVSASAMHRTTRVRVMWCCAAVGAALAGCGATLDSAQFTGDVGNSTTSFTINTAGGYRVAAFATAVVVLAFVLLRTLAR